MSFHTDVWVQPLNGDLLVLDSVGSELIAYPDSNALSQDIYIDLITACTEPYAYFSLDSWSVRALFEEVARLLPKLSFTVKGVGEEMRDIWVREFMDGKISFEAGPFNEY
ncbi:hypothetical protein AO073_06085 [Pseudomonas syringae ICMP 11293]|uniref:hypothetical protein n=1 Tax=Pseudomonas syringae TaxID=317 RepID=UPI00072FF596|nr:hypothetical protein [Pseudomonas syringae]KTB91385.1 hypothetical protein AO073_06085 [Pseudomonas syringae ICMP 11293]